MHRIQIENKLRKAKKICAVFANIYREKQLNGKDLQKPEPPQIIGDRTWGSGSVGECWFSLQGVVSGEDRHQAEKTCVFTRVLNDRSAETNSPWLHVG